MTRLTASASTSLALIWAALASWPAQAEHWGGSHGYHYGMDGGYNRLDDARRGPMRPHPDGGEACRTIVSRSVDASGALVVKRWRTCG